MKDAVTDSAWCRLRVDFPHSGKPMKDDFTAKHLSAAAEFKARLRHCFPGALWRGSSAQLDEIMQRQLFNIQAVETIDYIGYCPEKKAYVYNDIAASNGKLIEANEDDYFEIDKFSICSLAKTKTLDLNPDLSGYSGKWIDLFSLCFGDKGIIVLAYWLGSLFAEQIRERFESFPFLEIIGEPGAGKTTLLEFLWKLMGRSGYEGFDPMKASAIGFLRSMAQFFNLPVVLIEAARDYSGDGFKGRARSQFHWGQLKSLYNGGSLRTTCVKSHGNDTYDPQFRSVMVISQSAAVAASDAIMERIVHLTFTKAHQTSKGREAALELRRLSSKTLSGFLL
jgi:hypothetical protein